jgi:hypothetical protein
MSRRLPSDLEPWEEAAFTSNDATSCPPPDVLLPASEGTLSEPAATRVRAHIATCRVCRELSAALDVAAFEAPTAQERARLEAGRPQLGARRFPGWLAAAAAVVIMAGGSVWIARLADLRPATPPEVSPLTGLPSGGPPPALPLEKPAIELPATPLVLRGSKVDPYVTALIRALDPFRRGDYGDATTRLTALEREYPQKPHIPFYLGVAALLAGRAPDAIAPLQRSRALVPAGNSLHAEASWYLAVALERQSRRNESVVVLTELCGSGGDRNDQACLALHQRLSPAADRLPRR